MKHKDGTNNIEIDDSIVIVKKKHMQRLDSKFYFKCISSWKCIVYKKFRITKNRSLRKRFTSF